MPKQVDLKCFYGKEYEMWSFHIRPILAGKNHVFSFDGHNVVVQLPGRPKPRSSDHSHAPISCNSWRNVGRRRLPIKFAVHRVSVEVDNQDTCTIPAEALGSVNTLLFKQSQRDHLDSLTRRLQGVADRAFEYWLSVVRWRTETPSIRPPFGPNESVDFGTYLFDSKTRKPFYSPGHFAVVGRSFPVNNSQWKAVQGSLSVGENAPIWHQYIADAHTRIVSRDPSGAILSLAIAAETLIRRVILRFVADSRDEAFLEAIGRTPISAYLQRWKKLEFRSNRFQNAVDIKSLQDLFAKRNRIMHGGRRDIATTHECQTFLSLVCTFVKEGDRYLKRAAQHGVAAADHSCHAASSKRRAKPFGTGRS